ncbi:MAG: FeoA family protein [Deltaproteobacteria bacterium]|jgi:ferrous iron transport protein A
MPLTVAQVGQRVHLIAVEAGCGFRGRLLAMGFIPGIEVEVIHKPPAASGPILVRIGASRMALGWGMAQKMYVA